MFKFFSSTSTNAEEIPIEDWNKEIFISFLTTKRFSKQTIESIKGSNIIDELDNFSGLTLNDLIMVLPKIEAKKVMSALADSFPDYFSNEDNTTSMNNNTSDTVSNNSVIITGPFENTIQNLKM
ncbi:hypothetical protein ABK040_012961 [Willaertia magna]